MLRRQSRRPSRSGFTLVESLVFAAIVVLLLTLLLPAVNVTWRMSHRMQCSNNVKQISLALQNYHDARGTFPAGWISHEGKSGDPGWGWASTILPFMEQTGLANSMMASEGIASTANRGTSRTELDTYRCSMDRSLEDVSIWLKSSSSGERSPVLSKIKLSSSSYVANFGSRPFEDCDPSAADAACDGNGVFFRNSFIRLRGIQDGASHTILVGERRSDRVTAVWAGLLPNGEHGPGRIVAHGAVTPNDDSVRYGYSSSHRGGANLAFGDGGVRFVPDDVDPSVFRALSTRNGGEMRTHHENKQRR